MNGRIRPAIPYTPALLWNREDGAPVHIYKTNARYQRAQPYVLRYGRYGAEIFATRRDAEVFAHIHWGELIAGRSPDTGNQR